MLNTTLAALTRAPGLVPIRMTFRQRRHSEARDMLEPGATA
jgi:hypothetical protein